MKRDIQRAVAIYRGFREKEPKKIARVDFEVPRAVAFIGYVEAIKYRTTHGDKVELYEHPFQKGSRPALAVSADGRQLLLIGGRYKFTSRGIVDRDARGKLVFDPDHGKVGKKSRRRGT